MGWKKIKKELVSIFKPDRTKLKIFIIYFAVGIFLYFSVHFCDGFVGLRSEFGYDISNIHHPSTCPDVIFDPIYFLFLIVFSLPIWIFDTFFFDLLMFKLPLTILMLLMFIFYYPVVALLVYIFRKIRINIKKNRPSRSKKSKLFQFILLLSILSLLNNNVFAISDSNPSNNLANISFHVENTRNISIYFQPVEDLRVSNDENFYGLNNDLDESVSFMKKIYPVSDSGVNYYVNNQTILQTNEFASTRRPKSAVNLLYNSLFSGGQLLANDSSIIYDKFVLVYNSNYLSACGQAPPFKKGAKINFVLVNLNCPAFATAHELGHTYGLCDEYNLDPPWYDPFKLTISDFSTQDGDKDVSEGGCPNHDTNEDGELDSPPCNDMGCNVSYGELVSSLNLNTNFFNWRDNDKLMNIMGDITLDPDREPWIDIVSYSILLNNLSINDPPNITAVNAVLVAVKTNKSSGEAIFEKFYTGLVSKYYVSNQDDFSEGDYNLIIENSNGSTSINISFEPDYVFKSLNSNESLIYNETTTFFIIELANNTHFQVTLNSSESDSINKSPNTPAVNLISPNGGQRFTNPFNITWNASDADNDTLTYAILISYNNGSTYTLLDYDLNETFYEVSNAWFNYGTNYKVKILATDGVNTGSDVSE
ncbi:MAG: hypothetical protein ACTSVB_03650, partial [Candidatus Heimdallarchaeaceae archaeon]